MPLFTRAIGLLRHTVNPRLTSKAWASQQPNKGPNVISARDQAIALVVMFCAFFVPSGYILSHLDDYRRRPEQ